MKLPRGAYASLYGPTTGDRVVTHLALGLPRPLNAVELHLVA